MLVTLPGDTNKSGTISDFVIGTKNEKKKVDPHLFFSKGPIDFSFFINNTGNVHFKPKGNITITDMLGRVVEEVNPMNAIAYPGSKRMYLQSTKQLDPWGMYTATLNLKDGDGNQMEKLTTTFWGLNYQLVLQWLIMLVVIFFILRIVIKKYNQWIIKQAKKRH